MESTSLEYLDSLIAQMGKKYRNTPVEFPSHLKQHEEEYYDIMLTKSISKYPASIKQKSACPDSLSDRNIKTQTKRNGENDIDIKPPHYPEGSYWHMKSAAVCRSALMELNPHLRELHEYCQLGASSLEQLNHLKDQLAMLDTATVIVKEQSTHLSADANSLLMKKALLQKQSAALSQTLGQFTKIDDLCQEANNPMLSATTERFPVLLDEMEESMSLLVNLQDYLCAKEFAAKLASAQQKASNVLKEALALTFDKATDAVVRHPSYKKAFRDIRNTPSSIRDVPPISSSPAAPITSEEGSVAHIHINSDRPFETSLVDLNDIYLQALMGESESPELGNAVILRRILEYRCNSLVSNRRYEQEGIGEISGSDGFAPDSLIQTDVNSGTDGLIGGLFGWYGNDHTSNSSNSSDVLLVKDTLTAYRCARMAILSPLLKDKLMSTQKTSKSDDGQKTPTGTNAGESLCTLVITLLNLNETVMTKEESLFFQLWVIGNDEEEVGGLQQHILYKHGINAVYLEICDVLYQHFRAHLFRTDKYEDLLETCAMIKDKVRHINTSVTEDKLGHMLQRMLQDTQERLIYRSSAFLSNTLEIQRTKEATVALFRVSNTATVAANEDRDVGASIISNVMPATLDRGVSFLEMLYPAVDGAVFNLYADECVDIVLKNLNMTEREMAATSVGNIKGILSLIHAKLLKLCSLLRLREQLSRYDTTLSVEQNQLDFGHLAEKKLEVIRGYKDTKRDVEAELKRCCDETMMLLTQQCAVKVSDASKLFNDSKDIDAITKARDQIQDVYSELLGLLSSYVESPTTRAVLLRPIVGDIKKKWRDVLCAVGCEEPMMELNLQDQ